ncbi:MAG: glutathione S-transferase N-terminal domain-containing protein [Rhodospirillales bacterium]|nr:MAG: glutathione S-transferase N-terminal domain-containing protein [Rhodospirillales bacterium]
MIDVYTANTPNGVKVPITLEELGVPHRILRVDLAALELKRPTFLRISPNGRVPAIVDPDGPGGATLSVFESGAIVWYLAEKFGALIPTDPIGRVRALEYTFFQVGGIGPMFGQAGWFARSAPQRVDLAIERYRTESNRLTAVLDARLRQGPWLAGGEFSVADIMNFGWLDSSAYAGVSLTDYPAVQEWAVRMRKRRGVQRGLAALA